MANISNFSSNNPNPITGVFGRGQRRFYVANATFTIPTGVTSVRVRMWGAGGGGISQSTPTAAYGSGGGGGFTYKVITGLTPGGTVAITVGTAASGTTSFGAYCSATGGGTATSATPAAGTGGTGSGGDVNNTGGNGNGGVTSQQFTGGGAASYFGSGGDGATSSSTAQAARGGASAGGNSSQPAPSGLFSPGSSSLGMAVTGNPFNSIDFIGCGSGACAGSHFGVNGGGGSLSLPAGFPGGGAGQANFTNYFGAGLLIVEW